MTTQTFLASDSLPATKTLSGSDIAAIHLFGHAVDMAIYDLARRGQTNSLACDNLRELSQILWAAGTQIVSGPPTTFSSSTRGFALTVEQRGDSEQPFNTCAEALDLARDCGYASTGNLNRVELTKLVNDLTEFAALSLTACGIPTTTESYNFHADSVMRTAVSATS